MKIFYYSLCLLMIGSSPALAEMNHDHMNHEVEMSGTLGKYPMNREASGTSWQPESTPMDGLHWKAGDWSI